MFNLEQTYAFLDVLPVRLGANNALYWCCPLHACLLAPYSPSLSFLALSLLLSSFTAFVRERPLSPSHPAARMIFLQLSSQFSPQFFFFFQPPLLFLGSGFLSLSVSVIPTYLHTLFCTSFCSRSQFGKLSPNTRSSLPHWHLSIEMFRIDWLSNKFCTFLGVRSETWIFSLLTELLLLGWTLGCWYFAA